MLGECQPVAAFCGAIGEGDAAIGVRDHVFAATEINVTPAGRDLLFKLGIAPAVDTDVDPRAMAVGDALAQPGVLFRSEEHTSELQSLMRISYAVFCLKNKNKSQMKTSVNQ